MTQQQAYKTIGVSKSCSNKKILAAYNKKKKLLQLQLRNGMSKSIRTQAADKLKELTVAWDKINNSTCKRPKTHTRKKSSSQSQTNFSDELAQVWECFIKLVRLPEPLVVTMIVFFALWVIAALFRNL